MATKKVTADVNDLERIPTLFFDKVSLSPDEYNDEDRVLDLEDRIVEFIEEISFMVEHLVKQKDYTRANATLTETEALIGSYQLHLIGEITAYIPFSEEEENEEIESKKYLLGHVNTLYRDLSNSLQHKFMRDSVARKKLIVFRGQSTVDIDESHGKKVRADLPDNEMKLNWNGKKALLFNVFRQLKERKVVSHTDDELIEFIQANVMGLKQVRESNGMKLNWIGQKNQLYYVLRQLKENDLLANTYDELVKFIHAKVMGFEQNQEGTTRIALNRKPELKKSKRINLHLNDEDEK